MFRVITIAKGPIYTNCNTDLAKPSLMQSSGNVKIESNNFINLHLVRTINIAECTMSDDSKKSIVQETKFATT